LIYLYSIYCTVRLSAVLQWLVPQTQDSNR